MNGKKYELTEETKTLEDGTVLRRIRALRDIPRYSVKAGDPGGWIEREANLWHECDAWVCGHAEVYGDARVYGEAEVCGDARVYGHAWVYGDARVCGSAIVEKSGDYMTVKNCWSSNRTFTYTRSNRMWKVGCFHGTGEKLIAKAYKDGELSGRCYEATVRYVEGIYAAVEAAKKGDTER